MKKIIFLLIMIFTLLGCSTSREYTLEKPDRLKDISYRVGNQYSVVVGDVEFSNPELASSEKMFGKSLKMIFQNELRNNKFTVLSREELVQVMREYAFSTSLGNGPMMRNFKVSDYTMVLKITNIGIDDSGILIPIVFNVLDHSIEISVELSMIDNRTGQIYGSSGSGKVSFKTWNTLILIGDLNVSYSVPLENALKLAIRDAIIKLKI